MALNSEPDQALLFSKMLGLIPVEYPNLRFQMSILRFEDLRSYILK